MNTMLLQPPRLVPQNLPPRRAWRWCVASTVRDLRRSAARGKTMSLPNTLRLFSRRWADVQEPWAGAEPLNPQAWELTGRDLLRAVYTTDQPFFDRAGAKPYH
jgi:hypothetical protein